MCGGRSTSRGAGSCWTFGTGDPAGAGGLRGLLRPGVPGRGRARLCLSGPLGGGGPGPGGVHGGPSRLGRIGLYDKPGAWVRRVVANLSVSSFRRRAAEAKALARIAFGREEALPDLADADPEFWAAIRSLPDDRLRSWRCTTWRIDGRRGRRDPRRDAGTVKRQLHDGRRALARRLGSEEEEG